ncbi:tRNA (adenosine(37)-N6)-dimethylallyltransferase MiaA [Desmospora profundinema]|uniref:tRNA dimethylallyltransferase n=1 Tax=Desmospora profundinema TaxID=1571184 RepID=A0ABU1IHN1_9BACL|nr:tRNA (adenosine(37)-N6)-dimethylallyltransferase MiaA [Desmospora profundinema]MDR6224281.1 tRNA dimethylallyltransferase [Desmospora profundinema]
MPLASSTPVGDGRENLLVIVGPTAVGKTALSLELAREFHGEILSGDSMQVYRRMDIGTAKATPEERRKIPHHLIDLVEPDQPFSVDTFQHLAREAITDIQSRGRLPMMVGGTGLYIQAVTHGYSLPDVKGDPDFRREMEQWADKRGNESLHSRLAEADPEAAQRLHPNDRRRIIRALEIHRETGRPLSEVQQQGKARYRTCWIGLTMPRVVLYDRVNRRVDAMMEQGLLEEVAALREQGVPRDAVSMQALGYKECWMALEGEVSVEEAVEMVKRRTRKFAKRQLSWFRRLKEIHWFDRTQKGQEEEIRRLVAGNFPSYQE